MTTLKVTSGKQGNRPLAIKVLKASAKWEDRHCAQDIGKLTLAGLQMAINFTLKGQRDEGVMTGIATNSIKQGINDNSERDALEDWCFVDIDITWILDKMKDGTLQEYLDKNGYKKGKRKGGKRNPRVNKPQAQINKPTGDKAPMNQPDNNQAQVAEQIAEILVNANKPQLDEARIIELIQEHTTVAPREVIVKYPDNPEIEDKELGFCHPAFDEAKAWIAKGIDVFFFGETGSGKSTTASKIAEALDKPFFSIGSIMTKFETLGTYDPKTGYKPSRVREWLESDGGLLCIDEIDSSNPNALTSVMSLFDAKTGCLSFPDGVTLHRQPEHLVIITGNTIGTGANAKYNSRLKLDDAFLSRFARIEHGYDIGLENYLAGETVANYGRKFRQVVSDKKLAGTIVSPRTLAFASQAYHDDALSSEMKGRMIKTAFKQGLTDNDYDAVVDTIGVLA